MNREVKAGAAQPSRSPLFPKEAGIWVSTPSIFFFPRLADCLLQGAGSVTEGSLHRPALSSCLPVAAPAPRSQQLPPHTEESDSRETMEQHTGALVGVCGGGYVCM